MAIFGKKKLSLADILKGIEDLSDDEKAEVLSAVQPAEMPVEETEETVPVEETEEVTEVETENGMVDDVQESEEVTPVEETEEVIEEPVDDTQVVEEVEELDVIPDVPTETPEANAETAAPNNYDELLAAQNARIDSLESALNSLMKKLEQMVSNFDNQNFGYTPQYGDEDNTTSRMNAVMNGYAPRRAEQYR